jgi:glycine cleavage system H protein
VVNLQGYEFPEHLLYDIENQIWYERLPDKTVRAGFTTWAASLMGDVLVFTPKRLGRDFEKNKSFAVVEGGKWVGAARAAFDGVVVAHNQKVIEKPELLNQDAYGVGWMLIVRPRHESWSDDLVRGASIGPEFERWLQSGDYQNRTG